MTPKEFEDYLVQTRAALVEALRHGEVTDFDTYTKIVLDFQELIAKKLFNQFNETQVMINQAKSTILQDNRERFTQIMKELKIKKSDSNVSKD